jgi:hypothetical protein
MESLTEIRILSGFRLDSNFVQLYFWSSILVLSKQNHIYIGWKNSVADPGCLSRIPNPKPKKLVVLSFFVAIKFHKNLNYFVFEQDYRKNLEPTDKEIMNFWPRKLLQSPQKYGIRDPEKTYPRSRIQGSKAVFRIRILIHRIYMFFRPPVSGSISQWYGSGSGSGPGCGSFYQLAKTVRKTLIPTVLWLLLDFLSLKNDVIVPSKSNKQKNLKIKISFLMASWRSMTKIAGSGSTPKCHGSGTLVKRAPDHRSGSAKLWKKNVFCQKFFNNT